MGVDVARMANLRTCLLLGSAFLITLPAVAQGTTYYVSAAKGKGKKGTKDEPVRDLSVIAPNLKNGDTVLIAGGTYTGQGTTMGINSIPWGIAVPGMGRSFYAGVNVKF